MIDLKSIAVLGVDGTGKSTIVKAIYERLGSKKSCIQYMGLKEWETKPAQMCLTKPWAKLFGRFARLAVLYELKKRVYKHNHDKKIVIFDRYVDEQVLQFRKTKQNLLGTIMECLYKRVFGENFYRPTMSFYMTCNLEVSIARKDDINSSQEIERLKINKTLMDGFYKKRNDVITIDTTSMSIDETMDIIFKKIEEEKCFSI